MKLFFNLLDHRLNPLVEHVEISVRLCHKIRQEGGSGNAFLLQFSLVDNVGHGSLQFVLQNGHAFIEGEVVLSVDKLTVDAFVSFVDEVDTEVIGVGHALE